MANDWGKTWRLKEISRHNKLQTKTEINYRQGDKCLAAAISAVKWTLKGKFIGVKRP
jgi:hypothetical protein